MKYRIKLRKSQLNYFRRKARQAEPKEVLALLLGRVVSPELVVVEEFVYTKEYATQTSEEVSWYKKEVDKVKRDAEERGLIIVGDIHSHPNYWPVLSPTDHHVAITDCYRVCGVYGTMGRRSQVYFWITDSALPCEIEYTNVHIKKSKGNRKRLKRTRQQQKC